MKNERYPKIVGVKVPPELDAEIRRRAREDDRTVSSFLRRFLVATMLAPPPDPKTNEPRR